MPRVTSWISTRADVLSAWWVYVSRYSVIGVPVPFHVNFEEVNFRFYVDAPLTTKTRRGVVFIKEIVPRFAIATVARVMYGEPYECWRMANDRDEICGCCINGKRARH